MRLFDILPDKLFAVLASPLREHYAAILLAVYHQYKVTTIEMDREVVLDLISEYIEESMLDEESTRSLDDEIWDESLENPSSSRGRAAMILRKLEQTRWVMIETYADYRQVVHLYDYAIAILELLDKIRLRKRTEYQGYVFATYTLLYSDEALRQGALTLEKAYEQTAELVNSLKSLSHNIRTYIERVLSEKTAPEILRMHFQDYMEEIVDRAYHRLKTSDNVSRYRPKIVQKIFELSQNGPWLADVAAQEARRQGIELDAAQNEIMSRLDFIRESYMQMDALLEEIDRRNSQYANASFLQLKYLLNSSKDTEGQLMELLKFTASLAQEDRRRRKEDAPEELQSVFGLFSQSFVDDQSLFTPRRLARTHSPEEITPLAAMDEASRQESLTRYRERLEQRLTREKVNAFVMEKLAGRESISAEEMGIDELDEFLKLIYTAAYARSPRVDYRVRFDSKERVQSGTEQYEYKNIRIMHRRRLKDV